MAICNICGKQIVNGMPMVLAGSKCFVQGAGNGRAWVGQAPSVRYWKTFALLSVGLCQDCINKARDKFFNKLFHKNITNEEIVVSHYLKTKKIPKNNILAVTGQVNNEELKDISIKDSMMVADPYMGPNFTYVYDLKLYKSDELDLIGNLNLSVLAGDAWKFAPAQGLDKARLDARALFEKIGSK